MITVRPAGERLRTRIDWLTGGIGQDSAGCRDFSTTLEPGSALTYALQPGRHAWVQVVRGSIKLNGSALIAGDGAAIRG